ncbi:recombinase family protein [Micromonospora sp. ATA51]|uniref:recombinase family protein n=1 Tax=Micromonospora sp. ATA51 TaxID=2806098 RepID=UPI001A58AA6C|nr:recombinase family protein [Micromonospora sp. ATA51]MBM0226351.1 recombinase family protein [Micromonospora sp. ATA51]
MPTPPKTCSLYLRISVSKDESDSLERQERDLRRLALDEGYTVVATHVDDGLSGALSARPAFLAWLDDAAAGRAGALLAWRFDRISREGLPAVARLLEVLKASGGRMLTYGDRMDSDSHAFRITAAVLSEVAYTERETLKARVLSRQANDRRKGWWTRERPFGYVVQDHRLVRHPDEAPIVRELVRRAMTGDSLRALAKWLDAEGVPTPKAAKGYKRPDKPARNGRTYTGPPTWQLQSVRVILRNPALAGWLPNEGLPVRGEDGELIVVANDPILSPGEWHGLQTALNARSALNADGRRRPAVGAAPAHELSRLLRCECGGAMTFQRGGRGQRKKGADAFKCVRSSQGASPCPGNYVNAPAITAEVSSRVARRVAALEPGSPEFQAVAARWLREQDPVDDAERRAAVAAIANAEAAVADLEAARYERGEFVGVNGIARWTALYERATARLAAATAAAPDADHVVDVGGLLDAFQLLESLDGGTAEDRRALYLLTFDVVTILRDRALPPEARFRVRWAGEDESADA